MELEIVQKAQHTWEDAATNRLVTFEVTYSVRKDQVVLHQLTPTRVMFFDEVGESLRSIGVHTRSGRQLLTEQFQSCLRRVSALRDSLLHTDRAMVA
jgi:hypothetical protein